MEIINYNEMISKTKSFYKSIGISIDETNIKMAVSSLTMNQYANYYNSNSVCKINDQNSLATVGDAICEAYLMVKNYSDDSTKSELTNSKFKLTNEHLKPIGKEILQGKLFSYNNDIKEGNKKDYATAFEAIVGFIAINDEKDVKNFLDKYLK